MSNKLITDIHKFIDSLRSNYTIYAPVNGNFRRVTDPKGINLNGQNTQRSPKELFFPQRETVFAYKKGDRGEGEKPAFEEKRVILGIRPCDVKGMLLLDKLFDNEDYRDPYYIEKREATTIIGIACNTPQETCFCTSLGIQPDSKEGMDVLLTEVRDGYLATGISKKGEELISGLSDAKGNEKIKEVKKPSTSFSIENLSAKLSERFEDEVWAKISEKCLGCAACTYLCPTCHCFDVQDEVVGEEGRRIRLWDSCQFPLFTRHTSGHNPREKNMERMRNRIMHKFSYFVNIFGETACVGCGRCIQNCPVNFDVREVIDKISH